MSEKKRIFSGIQPSGNLTIGNYLGAVRNWSKLQEEYDCLYCVVDLHALTVRQDPKELRQRTLSVMALLIACGLDPEKNILFAQSHVGAHAELAWILNCYTYFGELSRMTQFKDKSQKNEDNVNSGLFTYPVLMAADILLYGAHLVPVGQDQKQHLEITRDIALRFNNIYGEVFTIPEAYIPEVGAKIMSLQEPRSKMSKSDENENNFIALLDPPEVVARKFKRAVTDSGKEILYDEENKPGISNLLSIYSCISGKTIEQSVSEFAGKSYGEFKTIVGETVIEALRPIQANYNALMGDRDYLLEILNQGAEKAERLAKRMLDKVYKKVGLLQRK